MALHTFTLYVPTHSFFYSLRSVEFIFIPIIDNLHASRRSSRMRLFPIFFFFFLIVRYDRNSLDMVTPGPRGVKAHGDYRSWPFLRLYLSHNIIYARIIFARRLYNIIRVKVLSWKQKHWPSSRTDQRRLSERLIIDIFVDFYFSLTEKR